jgi:hypothetical protein
MAAQDLCGGTVRQSDRKNVASILYDKYKKKRPAAKGIDNFTYVASVGFVAQSGESLTEFQACDTRLRPARYCCQNYFGG